MTIQDLQFELIRRSSFNDFDGNQVVDDLIVNKELWEGVIMKRDDLIPLRDIGNNQWNVDTLYILSSGKDDTKLEELVEGWCADEVNFLGEYEAGLELGMNRPKNRVLRIWFD